MPNPLTGDFEAVLQISGRTVNRLLASMHQNASSKPNLPSFPHSLYLRIGDERAIDGVRGTVRVQVSVPRVELIHGVTDRFLLEVGVRARYSADAGTTPLAEFIHGVVRAEYRIHGIDRTCFGWSGIAEDYIWVRVVKDSVRFTGTAFDDRGPWSVIVAADEQEIQSRITRQIATLLATRFEATPHRVSKRFRRGSLRSLSAPIGGSAVALPLGLSGEPAGNIESVNNVLLEGSDFAVGIRLEYLLSLIEPTMAGIRAYTETFKTVISPFIGPSKTVYHTARVTAATATWEAHGTHALLKIRVDGRAETDSIFTDLSFAVDQVLMVTFDPAGEILWLSHVSREVKVKADGLGATQKLTDNVANTVGKVVAKKVDAAIANVRPSLGGSKNELIGQLRTLDEKADAWFDGGVFTPHGLILRGTIAVAPRQRPSLQFEKTAESDGYNALLSWVPGGRIDQFAWTWSWFGGQKPGAATHDDRFVLRRPRVTHTRWGGIDYGIGETTPLPGLDGMGLVCLRVKGVYVDAVTGDLVPFESGGQCSRFGFPIYVAAEGRLFWRTAPDLPELSRSVPFPELALMDMAQRSGPVPAANTLLFYTGGRWDPETGAILRQGIEASRRRDAGLAVMVLFRDGLLATAGRRVAAEAEELTRAVGAPVLVNEDVRGTWSAALALPAETGKQAWRLISPGGGVTWMRDGHVRAEELSSVLDHYLIPSSPPKPELVRPRFEIGSLVSAAALHPGWAGLVELESRCPPPPLSRFGVTGAVVTFVQRGSASSHAQLRDLANRYRQDGEDQPFVMVVVDASAREAEAMQNELGLDFFATIPDPGGVIANRFGIRFWPTTLTINGEGAVAGIEVGHSARSLEPSAGREASVE
jgi:hypothetical protein